MTTPPPIPKAGDAISAAWMRRLLDVVRESRPLPGRGVTVSRSQYGTVINSCPPAAAASGASDLYPWKVKIEEFGEAGSETNSSSKKKKLIVYLPRGSLFRDESEMTPGPLAKEYHNLKTVEGVDDRHKGPEWHDWYEVKKTLGGEDEDDSPADDDDTNDLPEGEKILFARIVEVEPEKKENSAFGSSKDDDGEDGYFYRLYVEPGDHKERNTYTTKNKSGEDAQGKCAETVIFAFAVAIVAYREDTETGDALAAGDSGQDDEPAGTPQEIITQLACGSYSFWNGNAAKWVDPGDVDDYDKDEED